MEYESPPNWVGFALPTHTDTPMEDYSTPSAASLHPRLRSTDAAPMRRGMRPIRGVKTIRPELRASSLAWRPVLPRDLAKQRREERLSGLSKESRRKFLAECNMRQIVKEMLREHPSKKTGPLPGDDALHRILTRPKERIDHGLFTEYPVPLEGDSETDSVGGDDAQASILDDPRLIELCHDSEDRFRMFERTASSILSGMLE
jgi:hypothetical protein